jgi:hypothetical protein
MTVIVSAYVDHAFPAASVILVHGNAPGFDTMCAAEAEARGWQPEPHDAKWQANGGFDKQAGHKRNQEMVDKGADVCLAGLMACDGRNCFLPPGHLTHGTADCLSRALLAGIQLVTVRPVKVFLLYFPPASRAVHSVSAFPPATPHADAVFLPAVDVIGEITRLCPELPSHPLFLLPGIGNDRTTAAHSYIA